MTTAADLVARTQRHLFTGSREELNRLAGGVSSGGTTLTFAYDLGGIAAGASLSIGTETYYVFDADPAAKTATVLGAQGGSVAAIHASGDVVTVNPKFPASDVFAAINDDLVDLSGQGLYRVSFVDFTYNPTARGYDLDGVDELLSIYEVRFQPTDPSKAWVRLTNFDLVRNAPAEFPSGFQLILNEPAESGRTVRVFYSAPFAPLATLADNVLTVAGLPVTMHDLPPIGAAIRLVAGREVKRNFTEAQGETRRAGEVPPGAANASTRSLMLLRQQRVMSEVARLHRDYPVSYRNAG